MNLFQMLERTARSQHGDDRAITFEGESARSQSARPLAPAGARPARRSACGPGDRVAVLLGNRHEWPETLFGLAALGAVCVPVNVLLTGREVAHVCSDSGSLPDRRRARASRCWSEHRRAARDVVTSASARPRRGRHARRLRGADRRRAEPSPPQPGRATTSSSSTTAPARPGSRRPPPHARRHPLELLRPGPRPRARPQDVRYLVVPSLSWAAGFHDLVLGLCLSIGGSTC